MKFNEDSWFSNSYNATVCGVTKEELMGLEATFLKLINFELQVEPETFQSYYNHLVEISDRRALLWNCSCLEPIHCKQKVSVHHKKLQKKQKRIVDEYQKSKEAQVEYSQEKFFIPSTTDINESQYGYTKTEKLNYQDSETHSSSSHSAENPRHQGHRHHRSKGENGFEKIAQKGMKMENHNPLSLSSQQSNSSYPIYPRQKYGHDAKIVHLRPKKHHSYNEDKSRLWLRDHHKSGRKQFHHQMPPSSHSKRSSRKSDNFVRSEYPTWKYYQGNKAGALGFESHGVSF